MVNEAGAAESVKLGSLEVTVRVTVVFDCKPPPLPVTTMGYVPAAVLAPTLIVMVALPEPGAGRVDGLKLTVVPDGTPEAERLTALLKPFAMVDVMVDVP